MIVPIINQSPNIKYFGNLYDVIKKDRIFNE
jgi:hypothetical protein